MICFIWYFTSQTFTNVIAKFQKVSGWSQIMHTTHSCFTNFAVIHQI